MPVTAPPVSSASSASISGAAACAIRRAASANWRSTQKPRSLMRQLSCHSACSASDNEWQPIKQRAFGLNVLSAIGVKPLQPFIVVEPINLIRIFALPRSPRLAHLVHQPLAGGVLAISELEGVGCSAQPRRQAERRRHGHGAVVTFERNLRPAEARRHDVALDRRIRNDRRGRRRPSWDCLAASMNSGGTGSPGIHNCTGS